MNVKFRASLLAILVGIHSVLGAALVRDSNHLPLGVDGYDFIVAGGTAGSVVATRLSENPKWNILVIEAGPSNNEIFDTRVPGLWETLANTRIDWNYTTTAQKGLNRRVIQYSRARVLGGCSSHNAMAYTRGSKDDWDQYANLTGNDGLTWTNIQPTLSEIEHLTKPAPSSHLDPSIYGKTGKLSLSAPFTNATLNNILIKASTELKEEFPLLPDMNTGRPIGTNWVLSTIKNGERDSAATAYLEGTGNNVHVLLETQIVRVVPVSPGGLEFRTVEVAASAQANRTKLTAKKEIIIAGGAIGTPHILLHSGIGDSKELKKFGIKTLVDNPSVGRNLSDHTSTPVGFAAMTQSTDFDQQAALKQWNQTHDGPLAQSLLSNQLTWVRLPANAKPFLTGLADPTAGPNSPHIEIIYLAVNANSKFTTVPRVLSGSPNVTIQTLVVDLHPISRGSVTLANSNPFNHPLIDFALFTESMDIAIAREGIRSARRYFSAPGLNKTLFGTTSPTANVTSDAELDAYIRSVSSLLGHALGTSAMSPRGAKWGVVDPDFRVKGTTGLRVVDASVIPRPPSGHTQATVYVFAEMASKAIAGDYKKLSSATSNLLALKCAKM